MKMLLTLVAALLAAEAQSLPRLRVSDNHRFLVTSDNKPYFYLADTGWELLHRLDRKQAVEYLTRAPRKDSPPIQAVALAELTDVTDPNRVWRPAV